MSEFTERARVKARSAARRARDRYHASRAVEERLRALEEEAQEARQLHRRVAELTDVVTELLIPIHLRDEARVDEVLERYRSRL
jgi:5'-3' exonuclease